MAKLAERKDEKYEEFTVEARKLFAKNDRPGIVEFLQREQEEESRDELKPDVSQLVDWLLDYGAKKSGKGANWVIAGKRLVAEDLYSKERVEEVLKEGVEEVTRAIGSHCRKCCHLITGHRNTHMFFLIYLSF